MCFVSEYDVHLSECFHSIPQKRDNKIGKCRIQNLYLAIHEYVESSRSHGRV